MSCDYKEYIHKIKKIKSLKEFVNLDKNSYNLPSVQGIYSFWYDNRDRNLQKLERSFKVKGPCDKYNDTQWNWNLDNDFVCLYIGKTTRLKKRISLHLILKTGNLYKKKSDTLSKKTTSCQLRAGFDFLYHSSSCVDIKKELAERVFFSYIPMDDFVERFYAEDYLIGYFRPWFNIDSER